MFDTLTVADERLVFILVGVIELYQSFLQVSPFDDAGCVVGGMACPIAVEVLGNFGYDAACGEDIEVGKDGIVVNLKIFVADIASAQNGSTVVGGKRFVVHPAVKSRKVSNIAECTPFSENKGIKQTDFDIGMIVECKQEIIHAVGVVVVQKQTHTDAAFGRAMNQVEQKLAGDVVVPDIVLQIEGMVGGFNQGGTGDKGFMGIVQQIDMGNIGLGGSRRNT